MTQSMRVSGSASRPGARCGLGLEPVDEIDHVIEPTPGAGADATSRNVDGDAFGAERRVRGFVPKLARSRGPQRDRPSRIEVLVGRENALALAVTKNHTASFEERLKASSMIRR